MRMDYQKVSVLGKRSLANITDIVSAATLLLEVSGLLGLICVSGSQWSISTTGSFVYSVVTDNKRSFAGIERFGISAIEPAELIVSTGALS